MKPRCDQHKNYLFEDGEPCPFCLLEENKLWRADAERLCDVLDRIRFDTCQSGPLRCPICDRDTLLEGHAADCELIAALAQHEALKGKV